MLYSYKELKEKYGSDYKVKFAILDEKLYKLENGIYSDKKAVSELELILKKYPNSILSSLSAFYVHNLTNKEPDKIYLTCLRDSTRIKNEMVIQSFSVESLFTIGKSAIKYRDNMINIYDKERMLIELVKNKKNMNSDLYNEIARNYKKLIRENGIDYLKLSKYLENFNNKDILLKSLDKEGFSIAFGVYENYMSQLKKGKKYTKKDLTYDILYNLSIKNNLTDAMIGDIFQMSKEQVRALRNKYNLGNVFMRSQIDNIENVIKKIPNPENYSDLELYIIYIKSMKMYCASKGWKFDVILSYLREKSETLPVLAEALNNLEYGTNETYNVDFKNLNHIGTHKANKKNLPKGKYIDQGKLNSTRKSAGNLGEMIVYDAEIKKLESFGYYDLLDEVKIVSKTDDENITFDGTGYDIVSFNQKREKIYIEVKCSTTRNDTKIRFNITKNEVLFINGEIDNIDKDHAYIYYVYNINKDLKTADIFVITYYMFQEYELKSEVYSVEEDYVEV